MRKYVTSHRYFQHLYTCPALSPNQQGQRTAAEQVLRSSLPAICVLRESGSGHDYRGRLRGSVMFPETEHVFRCIYFNFVAA
jgi:hypothetical protein